MLRCLILLRSSWRSSSRPIVRRSMRLVTIARYDSMEEFTNVGSSGTKPSNVNDTFLRAASATVGSAGTGCPGEDVKSCSGGASSGGAFLESLWAWLRLPLRRFLFLRPLSV